jgi:hypothetical protein
MISDAQLCRFPDRFTVEYVRTFAHPIERVWREHHAARIRVDREHIRASLPPAKVS